MTAFWVFLLVVVFCVCPALLTALGSARRGNRRTAALLEGLLWPATWVAWFVIDNRAAGRGAFQGHQRG